MIDILSVVGARPQFVKASVVSAALSRRGARERLLHTGQHFDRNMSDVFFEQLRMPKPTFELGIHGGHHGRMTARMLTGIEDVLLRHRPDIVLVYGDTNSTLAGALAAAKLHVPVAHVEAGLRSFNRRMPEELNRILTDDLSDLLFAPTEAAMGNLAAEGKAADKVHLVGDVMFDAVRRFGSLADAARPADEPRGDRPHVLVTVHRAENTDAPDRMAPIVSAVASIAEHRPVVWPLHPRTLSRLDPATIDRLERTANLTLRDPVDYFTMLRLQRDACVIVTDSGGVQKEAFFQGRPCVTLRDETEWTELVDAGWNTLADASSSAAVVEATERAVDTVGDPDIAPYGQGDASDRIADLLVSMA